MKKALKNTKTTKTIKKSGVNSPKTTVKAKTTNKLTPRAKTAHKSNDKGNFSKGQAKKTINAKKAQTNKRKVKAITLYYDLWGKYENI